jgi:colicin import membrane protein
MSASASAAAPPRPRPRLSPRQADRTAPSFALALTMHALLFAALWLGMQWRTQPQPPVVAELWTLPAARVEAPPAPLPVPPRPRIAPPTALPPRAVAPGKPDADIVEQQIRKRKEEQARQEQARQHELEQQRKAEEQRREKERLATARKAEEKRRAEAQAEAARQKAAAEAAETAARKALEDQRRAEQQRLMAQAGQATGAPAGDRAGETEYAAQIAQLIKRHIEFAVPDGTSAKVFATFQVDLLPTGEIMTVKLVKSSALAGYDAAAERAIRRARQFPRRRDGSVPRSVAVNLYPVEINR